MSWIGGVGAAAFAAAWIPQCAQTWRTQRCDANSWFLALSALGSASLTAYAILLRDPLFTGINTITTFGALLNLFIKHRARRTL